MLAEHKNTGRNGLRKARESLAIAAFATLLVLPWVGKWTGLDGRWTLHENRTPADPPECSWEWRDISVYPRSFDEYFDDTFGFRSMLTRWRTRMFYSWLHMSPTPK
jgi:hypothetical protein